jgi:nitroreductase
MNASEAILSRRSTRAYSPRKVDEGTVRALLRAAVQAPSARNRQPWLFSVLQDADQLRRYSDGAKAMLLAQASGNPASHPYADLLQDPTFNIFYDATTLIVIGVGEPGTHAHADCWLAAASLMLTGTEVGLGSCCIGFAVPLLNTPEVKPEIGVPSGGVAVAPILVGYPSSVPQPVPRTDPNVVCWTR